MDAPWKRIQPVTKHIRLYSLIVLMLWGGFTVVNAGMVTLSGAALQPTDPFAGYEAILPGQLRHALHDYEFTCHETDKRYSQTSYCNYKPLTGTFSLVEVLIDQNDRIFEVDFTLRDGIFEVGDLMLLWGKPSIHPHSTSINFIWQNGAGATTQYSRHVYLSLDVQKVYFMLQKERNHPNRIDEW